VKYEDLGSHVVHVKDGKVTESWFFARNPTSRTSSSRPDEPTTTVAQPRGAARSSRVPMYREGGTSHAPARNNTPEPRGRRDEAEAR
jgi:hypothetical protein